MVDTAGAEPRFEEFRHDQRPRGDDRILRLHARKRALADAALEDADGSSRLSRAELLELLEGA